MPDIRVVVLTFDGVSLFHLSVPGMVFGADEGNALARYEVRYCAQKPGLIRREQGMMTEVRHGLEAMAEADIIVVPAWSDRPEPTSPALTAALQPAHERGEVIAGVCPGG